MDLSRPEGDVDEREAAKDLVLDRLRPAAADADDPRRVLALQPLGLAEGGAEAAVGALAALLRAQRVEHPLHPLGIVLVHLAAEGGDVVAARAHRWPA